MSFYTTAHQKRQWGEKEEKTACHLFALIQDRTREWMEVFANMHVWMCVCLCVVGEGGIHVLPFDSGPLCLAGEWGKDRIWGDFP